MKNPLISLWLLAFLPMAAVAQQPAASTPPKCQNVFIWPIKAENARAEGAKEDVKRYLQTALTKIKSCSLLDQDRIATLNEIAATQQSLEHLNDASKKVKTALKIAKAELVIFVSIEKAADGRLNLNMSLEEIETTRVIHTDTWTLTAEESQESNLKESLYNKVFELVHEGVKPPEPPSLFEKVEKAKNDKKRIPHLCNYLDKGYKTHADRAEKWLDNILYEQLKTSKREWCYGGGGILAGAGLFLWGNSLDRQSKDLYDTYSENTDPFDAIYADQARDKMLKEANSKRGGALAMQIGGGVVFLAGAFFIGKRLSWHKTLQQGKRTLGISLAPSPGIDGPVFSAPLGARIQVQF